MLVKLIDDAVSKAGNQSKLARIVGLKYQNRFGDFKSGRRIPDDETIGKLADYLGLDPITTIIACKEETDKEKANLWQEWLKNYMVCSAGLEPTPQASETCTLSS